METTLQFKIEPKVIKGKRGPYKKGKARLKSPVWNVPKDQFELLVSRSSSLRQIAKNIPNITITKSNATGLRASIKNRITEENLNIDHIPLGIGANKGKKLNPQLMPLDQCLLNLFVENSNSLRFQIRNYIHAYQLLGDYECKWCKNSGMWNGKALTLQLDHINGISNDHRLVNLRWLCPNCHSQTPTYAGRKFSLNIQSSLLEADQIQLPTQDQEVG
jgi:5-methylcytosine-specific restriction endonuclease McrA